MSEALEKMNVTFKSGTTLTLPLTKLDYASVLDGMKDDSDFYQYKGGAICLKEIAAIVLL